MDQVVPAPADRTETRAAVDLPEDARCATCGYLLRGLQELRCPECGSAFDPNTIRYTFVARWPELLTWWVAASVVPGFVMSFIVLVLETEALAIFTDSSGMVLHERAYVMCRMADWLGRCLIGPFVLVGLWRRRDWGRRLCWMGLFMLGGGWAGIFGIYLWVGILGWGDPFMPVEQVIGEALVKIAAVLALAIYLLSGLRRHSLRRRGRDPQPRLSLRTFHPRQDWLLLVLVLIAVMALPLLHQVVHYLVSYRLVVVLGGQSMELVTIVLLTAAVAGSAGAVIAAWRRPTTLRRNLTWLVGVIVLLKGISFVLWIHHAGGRTVSATVILWGAQYYLGPLLPWLAVLLFVFLRVSKADIAQVAYKGHVVGAGR